MGILSKVKSLFKKKPKPTPPPSSQKQSVAPVTVGTVTFGSGGKVTSTDPITQQTTTISQPSGSGSTSTRGGGSGGTSTGGVTFQEGGQVTSTDPITQQTTTISTPATIPTSTSTAKSTLQQLQERAPTPTQIGLPSEKKPEKLSYGSAGLITLGRFGSYIGSKFDTPGTEAKVKSFKAVFDPFGFAEKQTYEETALVSRGGSIMGGEKLTEKQLEFAKKYGGYEVTTYGDLKKRQEGELKDVYAEFKQEAGGEFDILQQKVDVGELTVEQAKAQYDIKIGDINKELASSQKDIVEKYDLPSFERKSKIQEAAMLGTDVLLLTNPLTSFIAAGTSAKEDPMKIDIAQLERGVSIGGAITSRPSVETSIFLGGGLIGGAFEVGKAGSAVVQADIEAAVSSQKILGKGVIYQSGEDFAGMQILKGSSAGTKAESIVEYGGKVVDGDFFTLGGKQTTTITSKTYFSETPFSVSVVEQFGQPTIKSGEITAKSLGKMYPLGKDASVGLTEIGTKTKGTALFFKQKGNILGDISYLRGGELKDFEMIGGVGKRVTTQTGDEFILSRGGKVESLFKTELKGKGTTQIQKLEFEIPETTNIISKVIKLDKSGFDSSGITSSHRGGTKTSFAKTYALPDLSPQIIEKTTPIVTKQASEIISSPTTSIRTSTTLAFAGTGLYERTIGGAEIGMLDSKITSGMKMFQPPSTKTDLLSLQLQDTFEKTRTSPLAGLTTIPKDKPKLGVGLIQPPKLEEAQITDQLFQPDFVPPPVSVTPRTGFPRDPFRFAPFALPILPFGAPTFKKKGARAKRTLGRTPSFAAAYFGVTAPTISPLEITGLIERPIISKKKKKKRKK